jgi:hypothetical protein
MLKVVAASFFLCVATVSASYPWLPIDLQKVMCYNASKGKSYMTSVQFKIDKSDKTGADNKERLYKPHIFTFFRTTSKAVTLKYKAVDANNNVFVSGTSNVKHYLSGRTGPTVYSWSNLDGSGYTNLMETSLTDISTLGTLQGGIPGGRRLEDRLRDPHWHPPQVMEEDLLEPEDVDEEEGLDDEQDEDSSSRKLLSSRDGRDADKGRSLKSKSKSTKSSRPAPKPSPRPAPKPPPPPKETGIRRRAGAPAPLGDRRRISSPVDGKSYKNPNSKDKGSYGYKDKTKIDKNFKGGYKSTKYGYSGPKSYKSKSSMLPYLAAGVIIGGGAMYMYSHSSSRYSQWGRYGWGWRNVECEYDSVKHGCWTENGLPFIGSIPGNEPGECINSFSSQSHQPGPVFPNTQPGTWASLSTYDRSCYKCNKRAYWRRCQRKGMNMDLNRDDVAATGFLPADMASPITITFYSITGDDFTMPSSVAGQFTPRTDMCPAIGQVADSFNGPSPAKDIYVTLTPLAEFADPNSQVSTAPAHVHGLSMIVCLCILVLFRLK